MSSIACKMTSASPDVDIVLRVLRRPVHFDGFDGLLMDFRFDTRPVGGLLHRAFDLNCHSFSVRVC